jgi:hypothetical protein
MKYDLYNNYCKKVAEVLGYERLKNLHEHQKQSLNNQLQELLEYHENLVENITNDEIIGRYELVTIHLFPDDFVEMSNLLKINQN